MLRMGVLTMFTDIGSSAAISCRDTFVGRYRSTFCSPALISSPRRHGQARGRRVCAAQQVEDVGWQLGVRTRRTVVAVTVSGGDLILAIRRRG